MSSAIKAPGTIVATWKVPQIPENLKRESFIDTGSLRPLHHSLGPDEEKEFAFENDERRLVDSVDIKPNGKYRSIVKLFLRYEKDPSIHCIGTGWLIANDIIVTAGHCVYSRSERHDLGRVIEIAAYIGYDGKASIGTNNVQGRYGVSVSTALGWLQGSFTNDLGIIKVNMGFTDVTPFRYENTPVSGNNVNIGVVGYPADRVLDSETGAQMYEMFLPTTFNRTRADPMLDYGVSTAEGQSGSPCFKSNSKGKLTPIGIHTYGNHRENSSTPIGDETNYGNPLRDYATIWDTSKKIPVTVPNFNDITFYRIPGSGPVRDPDAERSGPIIDPESGLVTDPDAEGFFDILTDIGKTIIPIASTVVSAGLPFFGPVGPAIAPLAAVALNAAAKLATESAIVSGTESAIIEKVGNEGVVERAILGEAALQTMSRCVSKQKMRETGALKQMAKVYYTHAPLVQRISPNLSGALYEAALRLSLDHIHRIQEDYEPTRVNKGSIPGTENLLNNTESGIIGGPTITPEVRRFAEGLLANQLDVVDEAFFFDGSFAQVLKRGLMAGVPILTEIARKGLDKIDQVVERKQGAESAILPRSPRGILDRVAHRAVVAEAALQAMVKLPPGILNARYPKPGSSNETEGFFDIFNGVVQTIAPQVIKAAPLVLDTIAPVVGSLLNGSAKPIGRPKPPQPRNLWDERS